MFLQKYLNSKKFYFILSGGTIEENIHIFEQSKEESILQKIKKSITFDEILNIKLLLENNKRFDYDAFIHTLMEHDNNLFNNYSDVNIKVVNENKVIGSGSFGKVFELCNSEKCFVKKVPKKLSKYVLSKEIFVLQYLHLYEDFMKLQDVQFQRNVPILYMEKMHSDVYSVYTSFTYKQFIACSSFLFHAVDKLHSLGIVHKDLKLENILINATFDKFFITDFGFADFLDYATSFPYQGTLNYIAFSQLLSSRTTVVFMDYYAVTMMIYNMADINQDENIHKYIMEIFKLYRQYFLNYITFHKDYEIVKMNDYRFFEDTFYIHTDLDEIKEGKDRHDKFRKEILVPQIVEDNTEQILKSIVRAYNSLKYYIFYQNI